MAQSGIKPSEEAANWFTKDFKLARKHKFAILEIVGSEVKVATSSPKTATIADLKKALTARKKFGYVLFDDKKIGMFIWAPVSSPKDAMVYASSADAMTTAFNGAIVSCGTVDSVDDVESVLKGKGVL